MGKPRTAVRSADEVLTVRETADLLEVSTQAVDQLIRRGRLPLTAKQIGDGESARRVRGIRRADAEKYRAARRALAELRASA